MLDALAPLASRRAIARGHAGVVAQTAMTAARPEVHAGSATEGGAERAKQRAGSALTDFANFARLPAASAVRRVALGVDAASVAIDERSLALDAALTRYAGDGRPRARRARFAAAATIHHVVARIDAVGAASQGAMATGEGTGAVDTNGGRVRRGNTSYAARATIGRIRLERCAFATARNVALVSAYRVVRFRVRVVANAQVFTIAIVAVQAKTSRIAGKAI